MDKKASPKLRRKFVILFAIGILNFIFIAIFILHLPWKIIAVSVAVPTILFTLFYYAMLRLPLGSLNSKRKDDENPEE